MASWTTRESAELYRISNWGAGYFSIADCGQVEVHPRGPDAARVGLLDLVHDLRKRGLHTPILLRFSNILESRVQEIADCFAKAAEEYGYRGRYRGVYPIKVNQQRPVVEEMVAFGRSRDLGLEVGSKPELLVALALLESPQALLVCNGYKDHAYIETALLAQRLGRYSIIVIDRPIELDLVVKVSRELGIKPHLGMRARLTARGEGKWVESSGDRSKFGLSAAEIVQAVERLRAEDMLDCLEMLHFHIGSQITAIRAHKAALREALSKRGATPRWGVSEGGGCGRGSRVGRGAPAA